MPSTALLLPPPKMQRDRLSSKARQIISPEANQETSITQLFCDRRNTAQPNYWLREGKFLQASWNFPTQTPFVGYFHNFRIIARITP